MCTGARKQISEPISHAEVWNKNRDESPMLVDYWRQLMRAFPAFLVPLFLALALAPSAAADDWPQWMGPNRDGVWSETGIVERLPGEGPKVLWRSAVGGGYSGPAVSGGKVY